MKLIKFALTTAALAASTFMLKAQWSLSGNAITSGQFLGTTNDQILTIKRFNTSILIADTYDNFLLGKNISTNGSNDNYVLGKDIVIENQQRSVAIGNNISNYDDGGYSHDVYSIGTNIFNQGNQAFIIGTGVDNSINMLRGPATGFSVGINSTVPTFFVGSSAGLGTTGNVGIGTTAPSEKLDVNGAIHLGTTSATNAGTFRYTGTDFEGYVGGQWKSFTAQSTGGASSWGVSGSDIYTVSTGNVGLGTTTPAYKLDINGFLRSSLLIIDNATPIIYTGTGSTELNRYLQILNATNSGTASGLKAGGVLVADAFAYANPGKNDLIVKGNTGLGVPAPVEKLDVNGGVHIGNTATSNAGTIRYDGTDLLGYVGGQWKSLTAGAGSGGGWSNSGVNAFYNGGTVTVGGSAVTNTKFNVLGDAFIANKYYYRNQYSVASGTYVPINITSAVTTLSAGFAYRVELVTIATGSSTGSVYIVRQTTGSTWVATPVNVVTPGNSPQLRVNGNRLEIFHNHASTYSVVAYVTSTITDNVTVTGPSFFGLEGAMSVVDGNVGVGTSAPVSPLHVNGTLTMGPGATAGVIGAIQLTGGSGSPVSGRLTFGTDGSGWGFRIAKNQGGTVTDFITVKDNGNVGIGSTNPTDLLTINGNASMTNAIINTNVLLTNTAAAIKGTQTGTIQVLGGTAVSTDPAITLYGSAHATNPKLITVDADEIRMRLTNGTEKMRIASTGNVGIGTTTPVSALEIKGDLALGNAANGQRWVFNSRSFLQSDYLILAPDDASGAADYTKAFGIQRSSGKVYIGDMAPAAMVASTPYRLYVRGGIMTEKVKVSVYSTSNWSDYVFANDYKLSSLKEVEQYIQSNKHLPGVPSADEVVKDGIEMAEMDATLLKKIEELTLYMIEQNKRLEKLEKENAVLRTKVYSEQ